MFNDPGLKSKLAKLNSNFGQDVSIGSIMVDKSKIVTITTETRLNGDLLSMLVKRRQINMSDDESGRVDDILAMQAPPLCKIFVTPAQDAKLRRTHSRLTLTQQSLNTEADKVPMTGFVSFSRVF
jgi:hypothetical protein